MDNRIIKIEALKYDRSLHRSWKGELIGENDDYWEFVGVFESEIKHPLLGVIEIGTVSYEFYWKNRCYNVFRFHNPGGDLRNFYCNVNLPPVFENDLLNYVDLDIDILVTPDLSFEIVDLDEFEENARKFNYPAEVLEKAYGGLTELVEMIQAKKFPFKI